MRPEPPQELVPLPFPQLSTYPGTGSRLVRFVCHTDMIMRRLPLDESRAPPATSAQLRPRMAAAVPDTLGPPLKSRWSLSVKDVKGAAMDAGVSHGKGVV